MNVFIFTLGTRGDVQPYVALGKGLRAAGHRVAVCTDTRFQSFITEHGLEAAAFNGLFTELTNSSTGREVVPKKVVFTQTKRTVKLEAPEGSTADDRSRRNYLKHLLDRYNEFAAQQPGRKFSYAAIYADVKARFGAKWDFLGIGQFENVCGYRIDAGLYRLVCRNNLTVADADFAHVSIRHMDVSTEAFAKAAQSVAENTLRALEAVTKWQGVQLPQATRVEFARRAAGLRWDADQPVTKLLSPEKLLTPVRYGDAATDLWTTFNVVQEHLIRGGDRYMGYTAGMGIRRNRTRPVSGLSEGQKLNKALWSLASEFANN